MRFRKTSYAVAVLALCGSSAALAQSLPAPTSGTLEAWFKAPLNGQTVSGTLSGDKCYLRGYSVARVTFQVDGTTVSSDTNTADGMSCVLDTTRFANGRHDLHAVAYDSRGNSYRERISINIQNSATAPAPANTPPTVSITSPSANQSVSGALSYAANATDNAGVSRVEFRLDGSLVATDTAAPYGGSVSTLAPGSHTLTATAFDAAGLSATSSVTFSVPQPNTPPTVSITSPSANQSVSGSLSYAANATDNAGVSRVEFRLDGSLINSDTSAPYGGSVATLAPGTHTLTATAFDAAGLSSASSVAFSVPQPTTPTTSLPAPTSGTLEVWFKAPLGGQTVSGTLSGEKCYLKGYAATRVNFSLDGTAVGSDTNTADGMSCVLDTTKFPNGTHELRAVAYDSSGRSYTERVNINVQNSATTPPPSGDTSAPTVSITSPTANQTLSGNSLTYTASASDNTGVTKVEFRLDGTLIATDTTNSWGGTASNLSSGSHTLTATAFDAAGLSSSSSVTFTVPSTSDGGTTTPPPTSSLPSTGVRAVPTFHSLGLYWSSPGGSSGCKVQYRAAGESAWKQGYAMWYDSRNNECRGSLVHLNPGTSYEVQLGLSSGSFTRGIVTKTWSEQFPIARTVHVQPGQTLNITQGGSASTGYVLYTPAPGTSGVIDAQNAQDHNVRISAPYVIVRGFTLRGARMDAVRMYPGARDVVIESNTITGWGRSRGGSLGVDQDSAVRARCDSSFQLERTIVQNNTISNPRYGSNSWSSGHPEGPQAISYWACGANHVFRYNRITSSSGHYYNDAIGGGSNFSSVGFPFADTDIYGNHIANAYDDGIEAEGANRNVRIWGNYIDDTYITIASTATHTGPLYVFRNVSGRTGTFGKSGQKAGYGEGRRYFFHNTILQPSGGASAGIKGNTNEPMTNSISRNNVWHMRSSNNMAIGVIGGSANNFDFDMSNGNMTPYSGAQRNGIAATPTYASGHGAASGGGGYYQLAPSSRGYDAGERLPNFNDGFLGARPDMGAHETGSAQMKFGPR